MAATGTTKSKTASQNSTSTASENVSDNYVTYVRQAAERTVDLPVGAVLTVADRVNDVVEPWTGSGFQDQFALQDW